MNRYWMLRLFSILCSPITNIKTFTNKYIYCIYLTSYKTWSFHQRNIDHELIVLQMALVLSYIQRNSPFLLSVILATVKVLLLWLGRHARFSRAHEQGTNTAEVKARLRDNILCISDAVRLMWVELWFNTGLTRGLFDKGRQYCWV